MAFSMRSRVRFSLLSSVVAAVLPFSAQLTAQQATGSVVGTVVDPNRAAVPRARLELLSESTGATREATTDAEGSFVFTNVQPASYTLVVQQTGFKQYQKKNVVLAANEHLSVGELPLELGAISESVTVSAQGAAVQTASAEHSGTITSHQIENLTVSP